MIAKLVPIQSARKSSFPALVRYLTDSQGKKERIGQITVTNCHADDIISAQLEIQNTQGMNKRTTSDKTCHLVLSFPEGERLSAADLNDIEQRFCEALGFGEHQRISVVHDDTNHLHMHLAINKIHPRKHTIHNPYYDYWKVAQLCQQIEQDYGLVKVNHAIGNEARTIETRLESRAGVESLVGWIKRQCLAELKRAADWQALHQVLASNGLIIKERGNGLVLVADNGVAVKASSVDRSLSKGRLIERLGAFVSADKPLKPATSNTQQYQPRPWPHKPETTQLYARYQQQQQQSAAQRTRQWQLLRAQRDRLIERAKREMTLKRNIIQRIPAGRLAKKVMAAAAYQQLKTTLVLIKKDYRAAYQHSKANHPRMAWLDWLTREARQGNVEALAVLRTRKTNHLSGNHVSGKQSHAAPINNNIETVTKSGTVIYQAGSATIRDDGQRLIVLPETSREALADILQVAMKQYGNILAINGTQPFRLEVAQVAAQHNLRVTFADAALERTRQQLIKQRAAHRTTNVNKTPAIIKRRSR